MHETTFSREALTWIGDGADACIHPGLLDAEGMWQMIGPALCELDVSLYDLEEFYPPRHVWMLVKPPNAEAEGWVELVPAGTQGAEPFTMIARRNMWKFPEPHTAEPVPADDPLVRLLDGFRDALYAKADQKRAETFHGEEWLLDGWEGELRISIRRHVAKGDPLDVALYAAFAWHHGWSLTRDSG